MLQQQEPSSTLQQLLITVNLKPFKPLEHRRLEAFIMAELPFEKLVVAATTHQFWKVATVTHQIWKPSETKLST